jgi:hypothetical protein
MAAKPNEPLTELELLALALAHEGDAISDAADAIPDRVWEELDSRGLIMSWRGGTADVVTDTTASGDAALFEWIEYFAAPKVVA